MKATIRILLGALVVAALSGSAAWANCGAGGKDNGCCKSAKTCHAGKSAPAQFARADDVHWVHRDVSFGNYLRFAKAEIPEPVVRQAPEFESIYFDLDRADLKPAGVETANRVAAYLKAHPNDKVRIEGNCCDLASNEYNMALGQRRAEAVKTYLVSQGIGADRIATLSYGEERLAAGPEHREKNRRADVIVWFLDAAN